MVSALTSGSAADKADKAFNCFQIFFTADGSRIVVPSTGN
jgi:hypothetical protein